MENPRTAWPLLDQFSKDFQEGWGSVEARIHDATHKPNYKGGFDFEWNELQTKVKNLCEGSLPLDASLIFVVEDLIRLLGPIGNRLQKIVQNGVDLKSVQPELAGLCSSRDERETALHFFDLYGGELFSLIDQLVHLFGAHRFQQYFGFLTENLHLSEAELRSESDKICSELINLGVSNDLLDALTQSVPVIMTPAIGVSMTVYSAPTNAPQSPEEELATQVNELVQNDSSNIGLRLLQRVTERLNGTSYRVPALFVTSKAGMVRDVQITILPSGISRDPIVLEFLVSTQKAQADELRHSINCAREAALHLLRKQMGGDSVPDYAIRVGIEGAGLWQLDGNSLGLAVALALMARVRGEQIGWQKTGDIAFTGAILDEQGSVGAVGGIEEKLQAAMLENTLLRVIVPKANAQEASATNFPRNQLRLAESLESLIYDIGLFDPWLPYLQNLQTLTTRSDNLNAFRQTDPNSTDSKKLIRQLNTQVRQSWLLCRSEVESLSFVQQIAARWATRRLNNSANTDLLEKRRQLIPVRIEAAEWSEDRSLSQVVFSAVQREMTANNGGSSGGLDESAVETALRDGHILLLLHGLENMTPSFWDRLRRRLEGKPIQFILVSTESVWWNGKQVWESMGGAPPSKSYMGRATSLDAHARSMEQVFLEQAREWVPDLNTPEEFFERCYWPLRVVPLDRDFKPTGSPLELETVIQSEQNKRILLVGDGGAGKTTALSKLFLAAMHGELLLSPDWPLVPLLVNLGDLQGVEDTHFYRRTRALPHNLDKDLSPLKQIPGLLVLLDGLNEVPQIVSRHALVTSLNGIVARLEESAGSHFILTCRKQESALPDSLARRMCRSAYGQAFQPYELLPLDFDTSQRIMLAAREGEKVLKRMGKSANKLLCNPLVLRLACVASEALASSQTPITRDAIYSYAVRRMLKRDTEEQNVLSGALSSLELARQGMAILAAIMVEHGGLIEIEAAEAANLLEKCVAEERWGAHLWWARLDADNAERVRRWPMNMTAVQQKVWMEIIVEEFSKTSLMRAVL